MNAKRLICFSLFLGINFPANATPVSELSDRLNVLKRDYISCLGNDYQGREAACSGIYDELSKQQALLELQHKYGNEEKQQIKQDKRRLEAQRRAMQQERLRQNSVNQQQSVEKQQSNQNHRPVKSSRPTVSDTKKVSQKDLVLYEMLQQRQLCERSQPSSVCLEISQARYKELQEQWAKEKPQRSNEVMQQSREYATRENLSPPSSSATSTERSYGQTKPEVTPDTTYEAEYSKLQRPQEARIRKPQELSAPQKLREAQELRKPQELGQRPSISGSLYEMEYGKLQGSQ